METRTHPADTAAPATALRPLRPADVAEVHRIWRATILLGAPVAFDARDLDRYARLCLGWYLDPANLAAGRADAVVVEEDGAVGGYLLACLDQDHFDRWSARAAVRWCAGELVRLPRRSSEARRFVRLRVRDGLAAWRHRHGRPFPAHMHVNLDPHLRGRTVGHHLVAWMDRRVAAAGLSGYFGEMNLPRGRSLRAIEAAGARVVARIPNRTFSWLSGTPVDRCVVARPLAERTDSVPS